MEVIGHAALLREFYEPSADSSTGLIGFEDCESLFAHLGNRKAIRGKYLARHFLGIQQSLETAGLDNVCWLAGPENLAGGSTEVKWNLAPLVRGPFDRYVAFPQKREEGNFVFLRAPPLST